LLCRLGRSGRLILRQDPFNDLVHVLIATASISIRTSSRKSPLTSTSVPGTMFRVVEEPPDVGVPFDDPDLGGFAVRG
jgi:hypothetical protein